jgi:hypothetical protein
MQGHRIMHSYRDTFGLQMCREYFSLCGSDRVLGIDTLVAFCDGRGDNSALFE